MSPTVTPRLPAGSSCWSRVIPGTSARHVAFHKQSLRQFKCKQSVIEYHNNLQPSKVNSCFVLHCDAWKSVLTCILLTSAAGWWKTLRFIKCQQIQITCEHQVETGPSLEWHDSKLQYSEGEIKYVCPTSLPHIAFANSIFYIFLLCSVTSL